MAVFQQIKDFCGTLFTNWLFTEKGTAFVMLFWGALMGWLSYLTNGIIQENAPFSYGVCIAIGLVIGMYLCRAFNSMFIRRKTKTPTYIEYEMDGNLLEIKDKRNIYKVPHNLNIQVSIVGMVPIPEGAIQPMPAPLPQQPTTNQTETRVTNPILVNFERPIHASHITIEQISGQRPRVGSLAVLDDSFSYLSLENLSSPSRFRVYFQR